MSFDIKFTRQGFKKACEAEPVKLNIKAQTWYSIYHFTSLFTLQTSDYDVIIDFCVDSKSSMLFKNATS